MNSQNPTPTKKIDIIVLSHRTYMAIMSVILSASAAHVALLFDTSTPFVVLIGLVWMMAIVLWCVFDAVDKKHVKDYMEGR